MGTEEGPIVIPVHSKLKMFVSLDIVGSTAFKNERTPVDHADGDHWTRPFLSFYRMSAERMATHWDAVVDQMKAVRDGNEHFAFGCSPSFWKGAGDEVLFSKTIESPLDALATVQTMLLLMTSHRENFQSKTRTARLDIKGTAWLAGFPLNNSEIVLGEDGSLDASTGDDVLDNFRMLAALENSKERHDYHADFIGPSVDLGFRLRDHASARRLMISADLVWLLCRANKKCSPDQVQRCQLLQVPRINYGNGASLKGVLDSDPYPLFWIEASPATALDVAEETLLGRIDIPGRPNHVELLRTYCDTFLDNSHPLRMRPYIANCFDTDISQTTDERKERLRKLQEYINGSAIQIKDIARLDTEGGEMPSGPTEFAAQIGTDGTPAPQ